MKFENTRVYGMERALYGMRNPKESYHLSDTEYGFEFYKNLDNDVTILFEHNDICEYIKIGPNDMKLAQSLIRGGSEHRKFMRQIMVSVDITAPLYWWKEFDTYKVGTVANSTSTMHKITSKPITADSFEIDDCQWNLDCLNPQKNEDIEDLKNHIIDRLEYLRQQVLTYEEAAKVATDIEFKKACKKKAKAYWKELIRWLPESWQQTRTVTMTYENLFAMCSRGQRRFHKLNEWSGIDDATLENFISFARTLPYAKEFIFIDE